MIEFELEKLNRITEIEIRGMMMLVQLNTIFGVLIN